VITSFALCFLQVAIALFSSGRSLRLPLSTSTNSPSSRKSRQLSCGGTLVDCVPANDWEDLRKSTFATEFAQINATSLDGRMVGGAFLECVIGDPKVQGAGSISGTLSLRRASLG
jgi:hypothetical protein